MDIDDEAKACLAKGVNEEGLALEGLRPSFTSESSDPSTEVLTAITGLVQECAGSDGGGPLVDSIAESLAADGSITEEQAQCGGPRSEERGVGKECGSTGRTSWT